MSEAQRPYDLLIFDWDGTLVDSQAQIVNTMQAAIRELNLPAREDHQIAELIGLGLDDVLRRLYPEQDLHMLKRLYAGYVQRFVASGVKEAPLFAEVTATLEGLCEAGYTLSIATGKSRRGLDRALEHHAILRPLFQSTRCADETASKPDPLMLRELLSEHAVHARRALMIGDTEYDMQMAGALGVDGLAVTCGVHAAERLRAAGAKGLIADLRELPRWLSAQGRA